MGQAFFQFIGFEPENVSKNYDILNNTIERLKKQGGLGDSVSLKQLSNNRVVIKGITENDKGKLMQYFRKNIPDSLKLRQTPTQIQFLLTKEEEKPKNFKEKCKAFDANPTKNPFNKTNRGKHMVPNKYTENLLKDLCKNSKEFCEKKKNNKKITQKYCTDIEQIIKQQVVVKPELVEQMAQQGVFPRQQVVSQQPKPQQIVSQQPRPQEGVSQQPRPQQIITQQPKPQKVASQQQVQQTQKISPYYLSKCKAFEADPTKNPFNKTNRGRHMSPNKYTENLLEDLCKNPPQFCEMRKHNKRITKKYCVEQIIKLQEEARKQIKQIKKEIQ
jgi:hypothetical protein